MNIAETMKHRSKGKHYCVCASSIPIQIFALLLLTFDVVCVEIETTSTVASTSRAASEILPITTPIFGACLDSDGEFLKCAFEPDDCPNNGYAKPSYLTSTRCHTPHNVKMGRCKAWKDRNSCLPSVSLCKDPLNWVETDNSCTIVEDRSTNYDRLTQYPQCREKGSLEVEPLRCVFTHDECLTTEEPVAMRENNKKCACYDVPTGMCYSSSTAAIVGIDTSFCALGAYDCPNGYNFMTAYELGRIADPPRKCRLCQEEDIGNYNLHETIVESGGCYSKKGYYIRCALESTECCAECEETFKSSAQLRAEGVATCPADIFTGGVCTSDIDQVDCTHRKEACEVQSLFVEDDSCSLHSDLMTDEPTYFGECRKIWSTGGDWTQYRCVWDKSECRDGTEEFNTAKRPGGYIDGCKCENVETGSCRMDDGNYYCAVSEYGCADGDTYISSLQTNAVGLDCRLCHPKRMLNPPTLYPTTRIHGELLKDRIESQNKDTSSDIGSGLIVNKEDDDTFTTALIYAGSFGGCFVFTSIAVFVYFRNGSRDDSNSMDNQPEVREGSVV